MLLAVSVVVQATRVVPGDPAWTPRAMQQRADQQQTDFLTRWLVEQRLREQADTDQEVRPPADDAGDDGD